MTLQKLLHYRQRSNKKKNMCIAMKTVAYLETIFYFGKTHNEQSLIENIKQSIVFVISYSEVTLL